MQVHPNNLSIEEDVRRFKKSSEQFRREIKDNPRKAKEFLIKAGIAQKSKTSSSGLELVPDLRS